MKILIATARPDLIGGVEFTVRDLALGLERRGHSAVVYSYGLSSAGGRPLAAESITAIRSLDELPFRPDIIHGHSTLDTMIAVTGLPDVPAIFHCHGAGHTGGPPRHPRIYRYAAMTPSLAQRVIVESNLDESAVDIVFNAVDLRRFTNVRKPLTRPVRALFYNSYHREGSRTLAEVRRATETSGLQLNCIGRRLGTAISDPEVVLAGYDLVFASGKSAIDALACGCAVIVVGMATCGELVGIANFDRLRRANFSAAVNSPPPRAEDIREEIGRYSAEDCIAVTAKLRSEADADRWILRIEEIYAQAIAQHRAAPRAARAESYDVARYLRKIVPLIRIIDESRSADGFNFSAVMSSTAAQSTAALLANP